MNDNTEARGVKLAGLVRGLDWRNIGQGGYIAVDPVSGQGVSALDPAAYDAERAARILAAIDTDAIAALVGDCDGLVDAAMQIHKDGGHDLARLVLRHCEALAQLGGGE